MLLATLALCPPDTLAQVASPADDKDMQINFEDEPVGALPSSFETGLTGKGGAGPLGIAPG